MLCDHTNVCTSQQATSTAADAPSYSAIDYIILSTPLILYGGWSVYRSVIAKPKLIDFVTLIAAIIVIGNLVSILVFKVRFF